MLNLITTQVCYCDNKSIAMPIQSLSSICTTSPYLDLCINFRSFSKEMFCCNVLHPLLSSYNMNVFKVTSERLGPAQNEELLLPIALKLRKYMPSFTPLKADVVYASV